MLFAILMNLELDIVSYNIFRGESTGLFRLCLKNFQAPFLAVENLFCCKTQQIYLL